MTIFERRSVSADGITLYPVSSHHQSHRLYKERAFIYTIRREKERKIGITRRIIIREEMHMNVITILSFDYNL